MNGPKELQTGERWMENPLGILSDEALQIRVKGQVGDLLNVRGEAQALQSELEKKRPILFSRLRGLHKNPFHNIEHALDVHRRLGVLLSHLRWPKIFTDTEKILLLECALRHDDGHVGNRYRQDVVPGDESSNEEFAVRLFEEDFLDSKLRSEEKYFVRRGILATSSWQRGLKKTDKRFRDYAPENLAEEILVFADVGAILIDGWDDWQKESIGINQELWVQSKEERLKFFQYVQGLYNQIKHALNDEIRKRIEANIREVGAKLQALPD